MELITTDVFIVGGGPAGCSAALNAINIGLKSVIIERSKFPRDKVCGDGVLIHNTTFILEKYGINLFDIIDKNEFISPKSLIQDNDNKLEYKAPCLMIKRYKFDEILWNLLPTESSTNIKFENAKIISMQKHGNIYEIIINVSEKNYKIETHYIIGADGYASFIRRSFFTSLKFEHRIASRFYMKTDKEFATTLFFDSKISPGYFWCFKMAENIYNTGVYLPDRENNIFELHKYFLSTYFNKEIDKENFSTWSIPNNTRLDNLVSEGVILTGDAAGLCDKLFGHGIDNALMSGYLSIMSIKDSLKETNTYPLSEIYRYKLSHAIDSQLTTSLSLYKKLLNHESSAVNLFKNELNSRDSII